MGFDDYLVNTYEDEAGTHMTSQDTLVNAGPNINAKLNLIGRDA